MHLHMATNFIIAADLLGKHLEDVLHLPLLTDRNEPGLLVSNSKSGIAKSRALSDYHLHTILNKVGCAILMVLGCVALARLLSVLKWHENLQRGPLVCSSENSAPRKHYDVLLLTLDFTIKFS